MSLHLLPPTDRELGVPEHEIAPCVCDHPAADHADAPDLPCLACECNQFREDMP